MKIGILSRNRKLYSTRRLREAAEERGHEVRVVDFLRCYMNITPGRPEVILAGESLGFDAVIPRIGASVTFYGTAVVRQFEMMGVFSTNESQAIARSRDKLRSLQLLSREGIGLPVTAFARSPKDSDAVIGLVGGPPLVMKLLEGTQGLGVVLAETRKAATSVLGAFRELDANILVQEFIDEAGGDDVRAFVVDGEVVAAMVRHAAPGEFRSNLHRGGTAEPAELSQEEREVAVHAADALGLGVAGVDLLRSDRGPLVIEVNSSPGLEGIETHTGMDVAGRITDYAEEHAGRGTPRELEMVEAHAPPPAATVFSRKTRWVRATRSGLLHAAVGPGDRVTKGQRMGRITDIFGDVRARPKAASAGIVIGMTLNPLVNRGDALVHLAEVAETG